MKGITSLSNRLISLQKSKIESSIGKIYQQIKTNLYIKENELSTMGKTFQTTSEVKADFQKRFFQFEHVIDKNLKGISG